MNHIVTKLCTIFNKIDKYVNIMPKTHNNLFKSKIDIADFIISSIALTSSIFIIATLDKNKK